MQEHIVRAIKPVVVREGGKEITLKRYHVIVNGAPVAIVGQARSDQTIGYAGSRLGRVSTRTTWFWEEYDDNTGNYEFISRGKAIADALDFICPEA